MDLGICVREGGTHPAQQGGITGADTGFSKKGGGGGGVETQDTKTEWGGGGGGGGGGG